MQHDSDQPDSEELVDGNKNETEIPIGDVQDVETRADSLWECGECGELDELRDGLPERCPTCGAPKEQLHYRETD
ncbi:MAG: rubredoxin-like domain-containing protein [Halobacterium sp.]